MKEPLAKTVLVEMAAGAIIIAGIFAAIQNATSWLILLLLIVLVAIGLQIMSRR